MNYTQEMLIEAVKNADLEQVREILINEPVLIDAVENGIPAAFLAAQTGDFALLRYIVEYSRANMNLVDDRNRNILHYGVMSGNLEAVRYIVERVGISPLTGDFDLVTCYDMVADKNCMDGKYINEEIATYFEEYVGCAYDKMYKNPIRRGMFPDPSIVRVGEDYYMVNSSFVYFPCIPVSHSKDLVNWEIIGHAITEPEWAGLDELEGGRGYWAPDISYHDGRFYITATYRLNDTGTVYRKQVIVWSDKPQGPYSRPVIIDEDGIDPSLFWDDDRCYMLLNRGARIFEIDTVTLEQKSEATMLYYGSNKRASEGPHLLKKDGWYYLFEAEGGTGIGHRETVARSKTLMGVYEPCPYNPILRQEDDGAGIRRCGHGKPVMTPDGEWYMVYLCGRMIYTEDGFGMSVLGRETCLDKITWTADGWPIVNGRQGPSTLAKLPYEDSKQVRFINMEDSLTGPQLKADWCFPRPYQKGAVQLTPQGLELLSSPHFLDKVDSRNIILRRQSAFKFSAAVSADVEELEKEQMVGMTCYYDENSFIAFYYQDGALHLIEHIGRENITHNAFYMGEKCDTIRMICNCDYLTRSFGYEDSAGRVHKVYELDKVTYLCDEGVAMGKRFTGSMVGMFAYSHKEQFRGRFRDFYYQENI